MKIQDEVLYIPPEVNNTIKSVISLVTSSISISLKFCLLSIILDISDTLSHWFKNVLAVSKKNVVDFFKNNSCKLLCTTYCIITSVKLKKSFLFITNDTNDKYQKRLYRGKKNIDFSNCNYDMALYFVSNYKHHFLASFTEFSWLLK